MRHPVNFKGPSTIYRESFLSISVETGFVFKISGQLHRCRFFLFYLPITNHHVKLSNPFFRQPLSFTYSGLRSFQASDIKLTIHNK